MWNELVCSDPYKHGFLAECRKHSSLSGTVLIDFGELVTNSWTTKTRQHEG